MPWSRKADREMAQDDHGLQRHRHEFDKRMLADVTLQPDQAMEDGATRDGRPVSGGTWWRTREG
jgi:hypothetical protein